MDYKTKLKYLTDSCEIIKINDDAQGFITALATQNFATRDVIFIAQNDLEIEFIEKQLRFFSPTIDDKFEIIPFLAWDCLPYDRASPKQMIVGERIRALSKLANPNDKNFIVLTSVNAIIQKTLPPKIIKNAGLIARAKSKISISQLIDFLVFNGYQRQATANDAGDFAVRGGIVDIVIAKAADLIGYRIDFFGDEIESIKEFDPANQLSQDFVRQIELLPASEVILNQQTCANFRNQYRQNFGQSFSNLENDHLYAAASEGRSYLGIEHWLPFFYGENLVSIFDYLPRAMLYYNIRVFKQIEERSQLIAEYYKSRLNSINESKVSGTIYNPIKPDLLYFSDNDIQNYLTKNTHIIFNNFDSSNKNDRLFDLEISSVPDFFLAAKTNTQNKNSDDENKFINAQDPLELMLYYINQQQNKNFKILIACLSEPSQDRIKKLLIDFALDESDHSRSTKSALKNIETCILPINKGFATSDLMVIGEQAIFGEKIIRKKIINKKAAQRIIEEGISINIGDLVVHRNHGIGKFDGIHTIAIGDSSATSTRAIKTDMLKIIYGGSDTLFVPVEDITLLTRYGADNPLIQLDRLGVAAFKNRKEKIRHRIKVAADELIKIAAARHVKKAPIFIVNDHLYDEFKARFGYVETEDQQKAIEEVEDDLQKGMPMDRLICGDVGFGKTEVAMRAAFIVASSNLRSTNFSKNCDINLQDDSAALKKDDLDQQNTSKTDFKTPRAQVAIITPTTLLCRQHYHNFIKRFENTSLKIGQLSRLNNLSEHKKIKQDLENGNIDIIIGTHALLNKNIKFKNLALVIIDEEQHFGVAQKERLKEFRNEVHILTLSATPIPRTLQMSLTGVKELSLIATPPLDRLAVRNFVMPYDSVIVREAVLREYQRSGKVFFVVPRIADINEMEPKLKRLLPEITITHAHGQMSPSELDKIMNNFYDGKIDLLLSTTIIESGIDISSANTIIIYRSEMFGLAQLYQLRGRVGRGKSRGYAYFMLSQKKLNRESKQKLEVMQNLDDLGIGFTIASHDMDIRGSGDILGDEQSGHIKETGVELYQQMLLEEIEKVKKQNLPTQNLENKYKNQENSTSNQNSLQNINFSQNIIKNDENLTKNTQNNQNFDGNQELDFIPQIKLGISLLIDEAYIPDLPLRMSFYKKIATLKTDEDKENLELEMIDRFGKMPLKIKEEINNLMAVSILKYQCKKLRIERLETTKEGILVSFYQNKALNPEKLLQIVFNSTNNVKLQPNHKLFFGFKNPDEIKSAQYKIDECLAIILKLK